MKKRISGVFKRPVIIDPDGEAEKERLKALAAELEHRRKRNEARLRYLESQARLMQGK